MTIHKKGQAKNSRLCAVLSQKATKIGTLFATFILSVACAIGALLPSVNSNAMQSGVTYSQIGEIWNETRNRFNSAELTKLFNQLAGSDYTAATKPKDALENIKTRLNLDSSKNDSYGTKAINETAANHYNHQLTSNQIRLKNGGKDIVVEFGGLEWTVTYLSYTKTGEPIATLWLANPLGTSRWSDYWYTKYNTTNMTKQSNLYGQSYIRSETLNAGSRYTTVAGASASSIKTDITSDASVQWVENKKSYENAFAKFTIDNKETAYDNTGANPQRYKGSLTEFLATPREVSWQEDQSWSVFGNLDYSLGNDSWDDPYVIANGVSGNGAVASTFNYYNAGNGDFRRAYGRTTDSDGDGYGDGQVYNGAGKYKIQYTDWADDYLWLPSLTETGYQNNAGTSKSTVGGVWYPSQAQRKCFGGTSDSFNSSESSWLRSGGGDGANGAYALTASGSSTWTTVSSVAAVRPALHLNLESAALAARGIDVPEEVKTETAKTYNGKDIAGLQYIDLTKSQISKVTLEKEDNDGHKTTATLTTAEYSVKDGVFYAANAGKYSVTFSIKNQPNVWDGTSIDPDTDLPYDPANVDKEVIYWEVDLPDGYTPAGPDDLRLQDQTITFTINKAETTLSDVRRTETGQLYTDGVLPALTCTTSVKGTITLDAGQTLHHDTTTYKWTFSPTGADCYNYKKKTGTIELSVKKPLLNKLEATFDTAAYASAVEAGTASPIYSSTPIENIKGIISKFVTIKGTKEDGKAYTGLISYDIDYTDTDKLNGKLSYGDNSSVKASYQDDDMQAEGVAAVSCLITGIPVIAVEMTGITLNTAYKTAYNAYEKFDTSALVVTATFNDNSTKAISLKTAEANGYTIEYADSARSVLWASDTAVTVKYVYTAENGKENSDSKTAAVTVAKIDFEGLTFEDSTVNYDGQKHAITVGGTFDATKMTAVYGYGGSVGDGRINVGSYTVSVVVTFTDDELITNYNEVKLADATLKIVAVDYSDLTNLVFNNATAEFIGQSLAEAIKAAGMPAGVTATYTFADGEGNPVAAENVKAVGTYTVTAKFKGDTNHNAIPDKTATLTITPKTIMLNDLSGVNSTYVYAGSAWSNPVPVLKVMLGTDATATNLVADTDYTVAYKVTAGTAGKAGATVVITVTGKGNYTGEITKSFSIEKATLNLTWNAGNPQYDGNPHGATLEVMGGVQAGDESAVTTEALAALISITYTKNGAEVSGVPSAMGVYKPAFDNFPSTEPYSNYKYVITNADYTYEITAAVISGITFEDLSVEFNGKNQTIEITAENALPDDITPVYYYAGTSNPFTGETKAGSYNVTVKFVSASGNYTAPADMDAVLTITPKAIADTNVSNIDGEYVYNGEAHKPVPAVAVVLGDDGAATSLAKDRDYTVEYSTEAYTAGTQVDVTITGIGNYTGVVTVSFTIKKATLGVEFDGLDKRFVYNGNVQGVTAVFTGVAESDKATVVPTIVYESADGTTYPASANLPKNAGSYVIKVTLDASFDNYESFAEISRTFTIEKATPVVHVTYDTYNPDTDHLYAGGDLPDLRVVSATFGAVTVTGGVTWQLVDGVKPVLTTELKAYVWEFVPTGDDAVNFNSVTNTIQLYGEIPGIAGITVEWKEGVNIPTIYTSTTLDKLKQYITVRATLDSGKPADGEITEYTLKGSWGEGVKPILNATADYDITVISANGKSAVLPSVKYYKVELVGLEVEAADSSVGIKTTYDALTAFDRTSIRVIAVYNDGSRVTDVTDYEIKYAVEGETVLWAGNTYVTVSYKDDTVATAKEKIINGLTVNLVDFDLTGVTFADTTVDYDGNEHAIVVTGLPSSGITLEYTYDGASLADGVSGMVDAGSYTVGVKVTFTDNRYIVNYNALTFSDVTLTISKIDYDGVDGITFNDVAVDYDYGNKLAGKLVATNIPEEVVALGVSYKYQIVGEDGALTDCTADDIVNAGEYKVTVSFTVDKNHKDIPAITKTLTVNKIDPTLNPSIIKALSGRLITFSQLIFKATDTAGTYKWVDESYKMQADNIDIEYVFTPTDTVNYNTVTRKITFVAELKILTGIVAEFDQKDTVLYTSYTIEDVKKLIADGKIGITITATYTDGASVTTETITEGYTLYLLNDATTLTEGRCKIGVGFENHKDETHVLNVTKTELASITPEFDQKNVNIYSTPDNIETLKKLIADGTVSLKVTGTNNDGKTATEAFTYTLTGDWSNLTADGKATITVTVDGTSITATFEIDVTVAAITSIKAVYDQKDAKIFTSTDLDGFKQLLADGKLSLVVTAYYNNGKSVEIGLATDDNPNGYTLALSGSNFEVGGLVNVSYTENGNVLPASFAPTVTEVEVVRVSATVNAGFTIYTDTDLAKVKENVTVTAYRNDGTDFTVAADDFSLSLPDGETKLTAGAQKVIYVTYNGADKSAECTDFSLITGVSKHATQIYYNGATEFTYTGSEQVINSGATTTSTQNPTIKYTINGADAKFTDVPANGELVLKITAEETDDFYAAEITLTITVSKADVDMSGVDFEDLECEYDGADKSITVDTSMLPAGVTVQGYEYIDTSDGSALSGSSVISAGVYKVTVKFTVADTNNYNLVASKTATLTVKKASYDMTGVTFDGDTVEYDGSAHTLTIDGATLPTGVTVKEYVYTNKADGSKVTDTGVINAGEYTVSVSFNVADSVNYNGVTALTATLTITKAQTVIDTSAIVTDYTYDGLSHTVDGATLTKGETGAVIEYSSNRTFTNVPAGGKLTVTIFVNDSTNYIGASATVEINVKKASLTITANDKSIFYGDSPANDGIDEPVGFVNGETVANLKGAAVYSYDYAKGGNVGDYVITVSGYTSANYEITFVAGALHVLQKTVAVSWATDSYVYNGKGHAPTASFLSIDGDKLVMTVSIAKKDDGAAIVGLPTEAGDYVATASSTNANYKFTNETCDFNIVPASITVTGTGDQFYLSGDKEITLDAIEGGKYKFVVLQGNVVLATFEYSQAHDATGVVPTPEQENAFTSAKPSITAAGRYVINYRITALNHNEYRGQWTVEVTDDTKKSVTITFKKPYTVEFGNVPETEEELSKLAEELYDGGYIEVDGLDRDTFLQVMTIRLRVDNANNATADTEVGSYTPYFEFKSAYEPIYGGYVVFYKTENNQENTNIGKFEIKQKELNVVWDVTDFVADGTLHLPKATVSGFKDGTVAELELDSAAGKTFKVEADGKTINITVGVQGDLTGTGGHQLVVSVDDENYKIDVPVQTISIKAPTELEIVWNNTSIVYDGQQHLPTAVISGFAGGKTFELVLTSAEGGSYNFDLDGKTITFTVTVAGSGNVLTDVGVYALSVASTSANYVIKNPNGTVTITAPRKLVVTWNQTTFEDNGSAHLPKALISGFNNSDPVAIELKTVSGGVFTVKADGKSLTFTVNVVGEGQLLKDVGNYTVTLTVDSAEYVIDNPDVAMSVRALIGGGTGKLSTPWLIGLAAALGVLFIMIIIAYIVAAKRKPKLVGGYDEGGFSDPYDSLDYMEAAVTDDEGNADANTEEE